jgi:Helicase
MTVHKAQGRTINKVVLDLNYKPNYNKRLKIDGIFVALSRVRCRSNIRLIKHANTSFEEAYGYISRLSLLQMSWPFTGASLVTLKRGSSGTCN